MSEQALDWLPQGTALIRDVSPGELMLSRVDRGGLGRLSTFMPRGFETYVRIFHPPGLRSPDSQALGIAEGISWASLASTRGMELTSDSTFPEVSGLEQQSREFDDIAPFSGSLPPATCHHLATILGEHTTRAEFCWFLLWDGRGFFWSQGPEPVFEHTASERFRYEFLSSFPKVHAPWRAYFLGRGPLESVCSFYEKYRINTELVVARRRRLGGRDRS
jgi:hypothetical protein